MGRLYIFHNGASVATTKVSHFFGGKSSARVYPSFTLSFTGRDSGALAHWAAAPPLRGAAERQVRRLVG
jgi:hypothetical protein